jgi:cation:H+ antiporter
MGDELSLPANIGVFLVAAAMVWFAGMRIARYADAIAEQTGLGIFAVDLFYDMGYDSLAALGAYGAGIVGLYQLR